MNLALLENAILLEFLRSTSCIQAAKATTPVPIPRLVATRRKNEISQLHQVTHPSPNSSPVHQHRHAYRPDPTRERLPAIDPYKDLPENLLPFALYVHVPLPGGEEELARIEKACNSETERDEDDFAVRRAPLRHDPAGQPLRAALTQHLDHLAQTADRFSPFYFAAVVDEDWEEAGLIVVTMNDESEDENGNDGWRIDQLRVPVNDVGLVLVNLQISNVGWEEFKEQYEDGEGDNGGGYE
ncbi:hypothetical protein PG997_001752 [Apiospora hydei]|uniref:DUF6924 domain-containing protein n=1 Tax=Apiospora hydei TaxID=1337664 RepID=A0ABR1XEE5_9PEZI